MTIDATSWQCSESLSQIQCTKINDKYSGLYVKTVCGLLGRDGSLSTELEAYKTQSNFIFVDFNDAVTALNNWMDS